MAKYRDLVMPNDDMTNLLVTNGGKASRFYDAFDGHHEATVNMSSQDADIVVGIENDAANISPYSLASGLSSYENTPEISISTVPSSTTDLDTRVKYVIT